MSTQNINNAVSNRGVSTDSAPLVNHPKTKAAATEQAKVEVKSAPSAENLKKMVEKANVSMDKANSNLQFSVDGATNKAVIKVTESESGKVIMQFPSEQMLSITRAIDQAQKGALLKDKA